MKIFFIVAPLRCATAYGSKEGILFHFTQHLSLSANPNTPKPGVLGTPQARLGNVLG